MNEYHTTLKIYEIYTKKHLSRFESFWWGKKDLFDPYCTLPKKIQKTTDPVLMDYLEMFDNLMEVYGHLYSTRDYHMYPATETSLCMGVEPKTAALMEKLFRELEPAHEKFINYPCSPSNDYQKQIFLFYRIYGKELWELSNKNIIFTDNAKFIELAISFYYTVTQNVIPWHDEIKPADIPEPESLVNALQAINDILLNILEICGDKEEVAIKILKENIQLIECQIQEYSNPDKIAV